MVVYALTRNLYMLKNCQIIKKVSSRNVSPVIPNNILEKQHLTEEIKLILSSKISILRVNPSVEMFSYCKIEDEKITNLPN